MRLMIKVNAGDIASSIAWPFGLVNELYNLTKLEFSAIQGKLFSWLINPAC
jgi:hypothetical protein